MTAPRIVGRYELFEAFASGGIAHVHFGRMRGGAGFARVVAIKRLHDAYANDARFRAMLADEARVAARVRHANVAAILDVVDDADEVLLVMEYVAGESLARLARTARKRDAPIPPAVACAIVAGVLDGLHAAHGATDASGAPLGIVHRDVSPQNVIVGVDGIARIVDFGVAKALGRAQGTTHGEVKGKAAYMAPEQVRGEALDRRADVFAAGIVLWELLAGRRLFDADSAAASMMRVLEAAPEAPSAIAPASPPAADAVVLRALARDRDARFETAAEMSEALRAAIAPAAASEVASWADDLARDALAKRAADVSAVENAPVVVAEASADVAPSSTRTASSRPADVAPAAKKSAPSRGVIAAALGGLGILLIGGIALATRARARASDAGATSATPSASVEPADSVGEPEPSASASATIARPSRVPGRRVPIRRGARADCNPPYVVDSRGMHVLKPECL